MATMANAKRISALLFFVCVLLLTPLSAYGATYTDSMEDAAPNDIKAYHNLSPVAFSGSGSWKNLPDKSFVTFSNSGQPMGKAVYKVKGSQQVTVAIYTHLGTFAHRSASGFAMGFESDNLDRSQRPGGAEQALYSPSRQGAYTKMGGGLLQAVYDGYYAFWDPAVLGQGDSVPNDLISYGVNIYASLDGVDYTRLSMRHQLLNYTAGSNYCYEEFAASVPTGAVSIMVEINDFQRYYDTTSASWEMKGSRFMTSLASVTLTGDALELGTPKPPVTPEEPSSSETTPPADNGQSSVQEESIKSSTQRSAKDDEEEEEIDANKTGIKTPSSKFEGVIAAGSASSKDSSSSSSASTAQPKPSSSKAASSKASSKSSASSKESSSASSAKSSETSMEPEVLPVGEIVYYQAPGGGQSNDGFTVGVVLYIVGVCCVILFILLRSRKK